MANIDWNTLFALVGIVGRALFAYALPWGFAFEFSIFLIHSQGSLGISFPGENLLEHVRDILLYSLSLLAAGVFWAFSYILAVAALHQGFLAWLSQRLDLNKGYRLVSHLSLGILTGSVLFLFLRQPGHLSWAGFDYYTPPLALSAFISCSVASLCAGLYSLRTNRLSSEG